MDNLKNKYDYLTKKAKEIEFYVNEIIENLGENPEDLSYDTLSYIERRFDEIGEEAKYGRDCVLRTYDLLEE